MKNQWIAEAIGTFTLIFFGCGAIVVNDLYGMALGHVGISLVFGLTVMAVIYALGNVSGAHINPAVTLGFYFAGRFAGRQVLPYILSQLSGAILAGLTLWLLFPAHDTLGSTLPADSLWRAFVLEVILSFLLMLVILNISTGHMEKGIMAGVAVGGTVAVEALMGGPVSGASMNPARSIGPALVSGHFAELWLYIAAPILGMFLAHPLCRLMQGADCCSTEGKTDR